MSCLHSSCFSGVMALMVILGTIVIHFLLIQFLGEEKKIWVNLGNLNL